MSRLCGVYPKLELYSHSSLLVMRFPSVFVVIPCCPLVSTSKSKEDVVVLKMWLQTDLVCMCMCLMF